MGELVNGRWQTGSVAGTGGDGSFERRATTFRNWVTADGTAGPSGEGGFAAESGRYRLYVSYACPWAHRTLILRALKGLAPHIEVDVVHPLMGDNGWTFGTDFAGATGDRLKGRRFLRDVYTDADPTASTKVTVPVLWDTKRGTIVSNESAEIVRMFNAAFDGITGDRQDFYPTDLRDAIDEVNERIYETVNNGVYRAGFASSQRAYDAAAGALFETLDHLDGMLGRQRYLVGERITEADWRLLPTLLRFDPVYHGHFKCNRRRLVDYPNLWAYARELYQWPGIAGTWHPDHAVQHYHRSHDSINPHGIVPLGPEADWNVPHGRERLKAA